jgi:hypothetical protein
MTLSGQFSTEHCADIAHPYVQNTHCVFFQMWAWAVMTDWAPSERSFGCVAVSLFQTHQGGLPQAVEQRGRHPGVAEHARPFAGRQIGGDDDGGALAEPADEVEQDLATGFSPASR